MSDDVSRLLRETVDEPSRDLDGAAIARRARRQTLAIRAAYGVAGLAVVGAAVATGLGMMADSPAPQVADEPDGEVAAPDEDASCAEVRDGLEEAERAHSATFGQGPEGREAARTIITAVEERPDCFDENEIDWAQWRREELAADADDEAEQLCRGTGLEYALAYDSESELAASHPTTAGKLQSWERERHEPDGPVPDAELRAASSDSFVALCQYEGDYTGFPKGPPPPAGDDSDTDAYRYLTVTVTDDPTESHPVGEEGEPDPVLRYSVSTDFDPEHPPRPDEEPS